MGAFLEMMRKVLLPVLLAVAVLGLQACGDSTIEGNSPYKEQTLLKLLAKIGEDYEESVAEITPSQAAALRQSLEADGQPIVLAQYPALRYLQLMAPLGQNRDVTTWSSTEFQTLALRQGMLISSRGFGDDLMGSVGPTTAQVARGTGTMIRQYVYLDGADQRVTREFRCSLATSGNEVIQVLGRSHQVRKVVEDCSGASGAFQNRFWFDPSGKMRQSEQMLGPQNQKILLQFVIDQSGP